MLIKKKNRWRRPLQDFIVGKEANVGSDHNLIVVKVKLRLKKTKVVERRNLYFNTKQQEDSHIRGQFSLELKNRSSGVKKN